MPEELFNSINVIVEKICKLLELPSNICQIIRKDVGEESRIFVTKVIKDLVEQYDDRKSIVLTETDSDYWLLEKDKLGTERYNLVGVLSAAYSDIEMMVNIEPALEKIQDTLNKTISRIKDGCGVSILANHSYHKEKDGGKEVVIFCVEIEINATKPLQICHENPDILIQVVTAGLPKVIKQITSGK